MKTPVYAYRLKRLGGGSARYGNCERCHKIVDTTYLLSKSKRYTRADGSEGLTGKDMLFGHKACLSAATAPL